MQIIVGVLRGGPSNEHEISLKTGQAMLTNLPSERFHVRDIYIDRKGVWHERGRVTTPEKALRQVDAVLIGLHGAYGEDGEVQKLLERFGIPFAGSDAFGSFLAMHKLIAKKHAEDAGLLTPQFRFIEKPEDIPEGVREIIRSFHQPVIVKPIGGGSSIGIKRVGGSHPVLRAIEDLFNNGAAGVLVEEYIRGKEATVGVVEGLRNEDLYALPAIEIIPPGEDFFSYDAKYSGATKEIVPGNFSRVHAEELARAAKLIHRTLGMRDYSRSDFIVSPRGVYYLETNSLPGLTSESLLPKALAAIGVDFPEFLSHLVERALSR